jgi:arylsulfatase A-like enzyme
MSATLRFARVLAPLFVLAGCGRDESAGSMELVRTVRDFLTEPGAWEAVRARADGAPEVKGLCPALFGDVDGADMPALVVPPPGEVRLVIPAEATPARLVTRVGVDLFAARALSDAVPSARFVFELRAGERVLAREEVELARGAHGSNVWHDLGGKDGIEIAEPGTLTLRTEVFRPDGAPFETKAPLLAGFGGLRLERRLVRERTRSSPDHPNVVLVVMDTLRADRLSTYGYARPTAPHLDALAQRGARFESCASTASWTWPATASLLTGLTPMEHGLVNEGSSYLVDAAVTLAESLQSAGLTTAAWSANPIVSPARNFDQGFERFQSSHGEMQKTGEFFEAVRAFLKERAGTRFFLYLHLTDPHVPLRPLAEGARRLAAEVPADFAPKSDALWSKTSHGQAVREGGALALDEIASPEERAWTSELYDASVWSGDHWLGELLAELDALDLADETIVAFTSDHGEELFERGFLGHGQSLRRELVHVPLVLAGPGVPRGKVLTSPISSRKLAPMLARLAGVDFAGGKEALAALTEDARSEDLVLFTTTKGSWKGHNNVYLLGGTDGSWKLDLAPRGMPWGQTEPGENGDLELFDLRADPLEAHDLAATQPEEAARLRALLLERKQEFETHRIGTSIPAGAATLELLDRLGYGGGEPPDEKRASGKSGG